MIKSFKHKGLERFFTTGSMAGIQKKHEIKLSDQLTSLHTAFTVNDMDMPGWKLHPLKGNKKGLYSVTVNGNWRVVFKFEDGDAFVVNYEDYH